MSDNFLFVEKYRPKTISECILPKGIKKTFLSILDSSEIPNMMFTGSQGVGKTTVAKALCNELGLDYILINGSEQGNIDTLRGKIKQFASSVSLMGGYKVIILDEADYLNPQSTQPALRAFIEEFSNNCRFIFTCNFKNRIIKPLHSRCSVYDFSIPNKEKPVLAGEFFARLQKIVKDENLDIPTPGLVLLIEKYFPDWRRVLNEMQRYGITGDTASEISNVNNDNFHELMLILKDKNFRKMRKWVVDNIDLEPTAIYRKVYDTVYDYITPASIPEIIVTLAEYQYKDAFVADHELNTVACLTMVMASADWK
jgi:DNA polymerase III delta prime subunit|tara:strand:+ start:166 stop:1101 length:936 start_codon:yes stop_codon:yes gene_type:complete